jgi:glycosyltransferase involved in cell wall biosynthesis
MLSLFSGELLRAWWINKKHKKSGVSKQVLSDLFAKRASNGNPKEYDIAIGFLEGWPVRYVAYQIKAKKKFGWLHSTFDNLAPIPELEKQWMDKMDHVVFVADDCKNAFQETMPEYAHKAVTIRNITDSSLIRKRAEQIDENDADFVRFRDADCFKVVTVCRVDISVRGLDRMVQDVRQLKGMGKKFLWAVVGDGPDLGRLQKMIADADVADYILTVGNRLNPLPFVKEADIFCMLSRYEGKPMVITESMILGTPPLVTRYLSAAEQIHDGVEGIIVENEDFSAVSALCRCMEKPEIVRKMKEYLLKNDYGNSEYIHTIMQIYFD